MTDKFGLLVTELSALRKKTVEEIDLFMLQERIQKGLTVGESHYLLKTFLTLLNTIYTLDNLLEQYKEV